MPRNADPRLTPFEEVIVELVRRIPSGSVTTQTIIARMIARMTNRKQPRNGPSNVHRCLTKKANLDGRVDFPLHRVLRKHPKCSRVSLVVRKAEDKALLQQEGINFNDDGEFVDKGGDLFEFDDNAVKSHCLKRKHQDAFNFGSPDGEGSCDSEDSEQSTEKDPDSNPKEMASEFSEDQKMSGSGF
ncbi:hypothetical protein FN846DRAFT_887758 [Sphaerosporella brunnea]|uniref:Methylated-DNA-[protein]-cysteine S-methyltransferase DNA binding domain-containing protein n=1 Tax=Sphaerosporella brunnea TaxID=1250544 RepID=A0A5J5F518_9PEZI|nr:hypothetical protein FN846DRAFT_887758 [Sphaerosporella brunnea]